MNKLFYTILALTVAFFPALAFAASGGESNGSGAHVLHVETHPLALFCLLVFVVSYIAVLFEEKTHLRKSKPVMLGAGIIWVCIAIIAKEQHVDHHELREAIFHGLEEYSTLLLFLLAAMTYISALQERQVFSVLRVKLVKAGLNMRQLKLSCSCLLLSRV